MMSVSMVVTDGVGDVPRRCVQTPPSDVEWIETPTDSQLYAHQHCSHPAPLNTPVTANASQYHSYKPAA